MHQADPAKLGRLCLALGLLETDNQMELKLALLLVTNAIFAITWIWGLFTMSSYIKPGKGWAFALTPFWIFESSWFTRDGHPYLKKARLFIGLSFTLFVGLIYLNWNA